jgi:hypothetical protein
MTASALGVAIGLILPNQVIDFKQADMQAIHIWCGRFEMRKVKAVR